MKNSKYKVGDKVRVLEFEEGDWEIAHWPGLADLSGTVQELVKVEKDRITFVANGIVYQLRDEYVEEVE